MAPYLSQWYPVQPFWWDMNAPPLFLATGLEILLYGTIGFVGLLMFVLWCFQKWTKSTVRLPDIWPD